MPFLPLATTRRARRATRSLRLLTAFAAVLAVGACSDSTGPVAKVATFAFTSAMETINVGQRFRVDREFTYTDGKPITPKIAWRSSAPSVASVDTAGWVTGIAPGNADITATSEGHSATMRVDVVSSNTPGLVSAPPLPTSPGDGSYKLEVRYVGTPDPRAVAVANAAVAKWRTVISGDLSDVQIDMSVDDCYTGQPASTEVIDDMLVYVAVIDIDGAGKVLARAGPCYVRQSNGIPVVGVIEFDRADLDRPVETIQAVFTHELGHVLGIGPRWGSRGLLFGSEGDDPLYIGAEANAAYRALGAGVSDRVPIENTGGSGTRNAHWRESTFRNELMTGFVNAGHNPLSTITVAALRDLGYKVEMSRADSYSLSASAVAGDPSAAHDDTGTSSARLHIGEVILQPRWVVDDLGTGRKRRIVTHER